MSALKASVPEACVLLGRTVAVGQSLVKLIAAVVLQVLVSLQFPWTDPPQGCTLPQLLSPPPPQLDTAVEANTSPTNATNRAREGFVMIRASPRAPSSGNKQIRLRDF